MGGGLNCIAKGIDRVNLYLMEKFVVQPVHSVIKISSKLAYPECNFESNRNGRNLCINFRESIIFLNFFHGIS